MRIPNKMRLPIDTILYEILDQIKTGSAYAGNEIEFMKHLIDLIHEEIQEMEGKEDNRCPYEQVDDDGTMRKVR